MYIKFAVGRSRFATFIDESAAKTTNPTDLIGPEDKYAAFKASVDMTSQVLGNYIQLFTCSNSTRVQYGYSDCQSLYIAIIPIQT